MHGIDPTWAQIEAVVARGEDAAYLRGRVILDERYWRTGPYPAEGPAPSPGFLAWANDYQAAATIPRLLHLRVDKH